MTKSKWTVGDRFAELGTPWFTLIGEHIQTDNQILDYWRVEKADSVIVLPIQGDRIVLPPALYRPGIGTETLDFPGGRCLASQSRPDVARQLLHRELGVESGAIAVLKPLNSRGWPVNSSFSNQKLYGFVADVQPGPVANLGSSYSTDAKGIKHLLTDLTCLQCRMVLMEWWRSQE
jgi:hypothetical protein